MVSGVDAGTETGKGSGVSLDLVTPVWVGPKSRGPTEGYESPTRESNPPSESGVGLKETHPERTRLTVGLERGRGNTRVATSGCGGGGPSGGSRELGST